jgi:ribonucleoside-diphosphate reductase alpha chain
MAAWKSGCKGCTIYREGSRDGVLLRKEEIVANHGDNHAVERPKILDAQMLFFQNNKEKWVAFIGILENRPYEIFTGKVDEKIATIPKSPNATGGKIIRERINGESRYDFHGVDYSNRPIVLEGISACFDPEFWNYAKLISGIMRHRMPLPNLIQLIEGLNFKEENINTWKVGVIRGLKQFVAEGTEIKVKCPECGQDNLIYQEGCLTCKNCGYGKC